MSDSNPILFSSAQSIEAYQQAIEQSTQAVMQWLKQPEMYQAKRSQSCATVLSWISTRKGWATKRRLNAPWSSS